MTARKLIPPFLLTLSLVMLGVGIGPRANQEGDMPAAAKRGPLAPGELLAGTNSCSGRACHGNLSPRSDSRIGHNEHTIWSATDTHSQAYATLFSEQSRKIISLAGTRNLQGEIIQAHLDDRCLVCHTSGFSTTTLERVPHLAEELASGVGCEACHGAAKDWLAPHTGAFRGSMKSRFGMLGTADITAYAAACVGCHVGGPPTADEKTPRNVTHDMIAAGHPRLNFEFSSYLANLPRHWSVDTEKKRGEDAEARIWLMGQIRSVEAALRLLEYRATLESRSTWPELAEFDCYACHRELQHPTLRHQRNNSGGLVGSVPFQKWYLAAWSADPPKENNADIANLVEIMEKPAPNRKDSADAAAKLKYQLRVLDDVPHMDRPETQFWLKRLTNDVGRILSCWDSAQQAYLGLAALSRSYGDLQLQDAVDALGQELTFRPDRHGNLYDSPKGVPPPNSEQVRKHFERIKQLLKD